MKTMLELAVIATLLLAAGSWTTPVGANEVIVADDLSWWLPKEPDMDVFKVRCTETSNLMCVTLVNEDALRVLWATAVVSSPAGLAGDAWAEVVLGNDLRGHCFKTEGIRKYLMEGYVSTSLNGGGPLPYELHAQCWSGSPSTGYTTRGTSVTKTQDPSAP